MENLKKLLEQRQSTDAMDNKRALVGGLIGVEALQTAITQRYYDLMLNEGVTQISDKAISRCMNMGSWFFDGGKIGLFLQGDFGTGKSTLLKATSMTIGELFRWLPASKRKSAFYCPANEIRGRFEQGLFEEIKNADLLLLDDLGVDNVEVVVYGNNVNLFYELFMSRYEGKKPTIITSNHTKEQVIEIYCGGKTSQNRLRDRFLDMFDVRRVSGGSFRELNSLKSK